MVSLTGISSGAATITTPVCAGSLEDVEHPAGLVADQAHLHQLVDALAARRADRRCGRWRTRRRRRGRSGLPSPPSTNLPTVRISFTPGAALATKSNVRARGPMRASSGSFSCSFRYSLSDSSVSIDMSQRPGPDLPLRERRSARSRRSRPGCPWRRPRRPACACLARDASRPERGRDRRLAHAALAGDEHQPPVEQVPGAATGTVDDRQPPKPMRRLSSGEPIST